MTRPCKMMLEELQVRKITALVCGWGEDSVVRSDSRGVEGRGSSSKNTVQVLLECFRGCVEHIYYSEAMTGP